MANRANLLKCIEAVLPATNSSGVSLDHQYVTISDNKVRASDGSIRIESELMDPLPGLTCSVHGAQLVSFLKGLNSDDVNLKFDGSNLTASFGKSRMKFLSRKPQNTNPIIAGEKEITGNIRKLIEGLVTCKGNVVNDVLAGALCGVKIDNNFVIATNRFRLIRYGIEESNAKCTVPVRFINAISKYKDIESTRMLCDESSIIMVSNSDTRVTVQSKLVNGDYPNLDVYFSTDKEDKVSVKFKDDVHGIISRHALLVKTNDFSNKESTISINNETCTITTTNTLIGELVDVIELKESLNTKLSFIINPCLITDTLIDCWEFSYFIKGKYIMFESVTFKYLILTRE